MSTGGLTVADSTVSNNRASSGGGIASFDSSTNVTNSTISGNVAYTGGGFYNDGSGTGFIEQHP